jgi:hypothetical protein
MIISRPLSLPLLSSSTFFPLKNRKNSTIEYITLITLSTTGGVEERKERKNTSTPSFAAVRLDDVKNYTNTSSELKWFSLFSIFFFF